MGENVLSVYAQANTVITDIMSFQIKAGGWKVKLFEV